MADAMIALVNMYRSKKITDNEFDTKFANLVAFYQQKFDIKKIPLIFKGWVRCAPSEVDYKHEEDIEIVIWHQRGIYTIKYNLRYNIIDRLDLKIPNILDDFIHDCERIGYQLYFKI
jgi:hypothetical protein